MRTPVATAGVNVAVVGGTVDGTRPGGGGGEVCGPGYGYAGRGGDTTDVTGRCGGDVVVIWWP